MRTSLVARSYADTLLALAQRQGGNAVEEFGRAMDMVAELLRQEPRVRAFLESPVIDRGKKKAALRASFRGRVPEMFLRFLLVVTDKGRERLFAEMALAYQDRVDVMLGRVRADVVTAQPADEAIRADIRRSLEAKLGRTVVPIFRVDPELIGGVVVRVEDQIIDASLRRRFTDLRRRLLETPVLHSSRPQQA
jgi:F-type H+-transporting ATPase subunit delta